MIIAKIFLTASLITTLIYCVKKTRKPDYSLGLFSHKRTPKKKIYEPSTIDYMVMYGHLALVSIGIILVVGVGVSSILNFIYPHSVMYGIGGAAGFWSIAVLEKLERARTVTSDTR